MPKYDVIVIGGGHNGLTHAAYLARAGRRVLVLERRHVLGGAAVTEEVFPGFHISVCSYVVSLLRPQIIRDLDLAPPRLRGAAARRHVHADAGRRLPVARQRPRPHAARDSAAFAARRRSLRRVRQGDDRHGALRQADARRPRARSVLACRRSICASCSGSAAASSRCRPNRATGSCS